MPLGAVSPCVWVSRAGGRNGNRWEGETFAGAGATGGLIGSGFDDAGAALKAGAAGSLCAGPSGEASACDSPSSPS